MIASQCQLAVQQSESAICVNISPPSEPPHPPTLEPFFSDPDTSSLFLHFMGTPIVKYMNSQYILGLAQALSQCSVFCN